MTAGKIANNGSAALIVGSSRGLPAMLIVLALCAAPLDAAAQKQERSGKEVVEEGCVKCHGPGTNGAPKIGDQQAWKKLSSAGLTSLTAVALKGIRNMPPHGANMKLTDTEIKRGVTYMVNQSGGNWVEPASRQQPAAKRSGEEVVKMRCATCHETGKGGAPKIGDRDAWIPRLKDGLDATVRSAINGHGGMQARGGMPNLTDSELKDAITYMVNKGRVPEGSK